MSAQKISLNSIGVIAACLFSTISLVWQFVEHFNIERHEKERTHAELRTVFSQLNNLTLRSASPETCYAEPNGGVLCSSSQCLGGLALQAAQRERYQLLTLQAEYIASRVTHELTPVEWLQLANACYVSGYFEKSKDYAIEAREQEKRNTKAAEQSIAFQSHLIEAQVYYFQKEPENGNDSIAAALKVVDGNSSWNSTQKGLFKIQAYLSCAAMHAALGEDNCSLKCLEKVHGILQDIPYTPLTQQLKNSMEDQLTAIAWETKSDHFSKKSFTDLKDEIMKRVENARKDKQAEPVPAPIDSNEPMVAPEPNILTSVLR